MVMQQVTIQLPQDTLRKFDRLAKDRGQARDTLLVQLVQEYVRGVDRQREIAQGTLAALGVKPRRTRGKRTFNARKVAQAVERTFGTRDAVELINKSRDRGMANE